MWYAIGAGCFVAFLVYCAVRSGALADQDIKRILENQKKFEGEEDLYDGE